MTARPLLHIVHVEERIKAPTKRDLNENPMMLGEGIIYWTGARIEQLRLERTAYPAGDGLEIADKRCPFGGVSLAG